VDDESSKPSQGLPSFSSRCHHTEHYPSGIAPRRSSLHRRDKQKGCTSSNIRVDIILLVIIGMTICTQGGIGRVSADRLGRWKPRRNQLGTRERLSGACQGLLRSAGQSVDRECQRVDHNPSDSSRQIGWVAIEADLYCFPVKRIAVRCRKKNGQWGWLF